MAVFEVIGEVVPTISTDIGVKAENADELRAFWKDNQIDTQLWTAPGDVPVISIGRQVDIAACSVGDRVRLTFETVVRAGKTGIRTIDFQRITPPA